MKGLRKTALWWRGSGREGDNNTGNAETCDASKGDAEQGDGHVPESERRSSRKAKGTLTALTGTLQKSNKDGNRFPPLSAYLVPKTGYLGRLTRQHLVALQCMREWWETQQTADHKALDDWTASYTEEEAVQWRKNVQDVLLRGSSLLVPKREEQQERKEQEEEEEEEEEEKEIPSYLETKADPQHIDALHTTLSERHGLSAFETQLETSTVQDRLQPLAFHLLTREKGFTELDVLLLRFLRARHFDVAKAQSMLENYLSWYSTCRISHITKTLRFPWAKELRRLYPHGFHGVDRLGRPIYIERIGMAHLSSILSIAPLSHLLAYWITQYEYMRQVVFPACSIAAQRRVDHTLTILDLTGLGFSHVRSESRTMLRHLARLSQNYYPETLGTMVLVNAPSIFSPMKRFADSLLDEATVSKIHVITSRSTHWKQYLQELVAPDQLPVFLGGTAPDEDWVNGRFGPWNDPQIQTQLKERFGDWVADHIVHDPFVSADLCHPIDDLSYLDNILSSKRHSKSKQHPTIPHDQHRRESDSALGTASGSADDDSPTKDVGDPPPLLDITNSDIESLKKEEISDHHSDVSL